MGFVVRGDPAFDDPVASSKRRRDELVARTSGDDALANCIGEFVYDGIPDSRDIRSKLSTVVGGQIAVFDNGGFDFQSHRGGPPSFTQGPPRATGRAPAKWPEPM
jgi:hypothetical protein